MSTPILFKELLIEKKEFLELNKKILINSIISKHEDLYLNRDNYIEHNTEDTEFFLRNTSNLIRTSIDNTLNRK